MLRLVAVASAFLAGACQSTIESDSVNRTLHRPDDGVTAFVQACVTANATRESAFRVFDEFNVNHGIPRKANDEFPGGEFVDQEYVEKVGYLKVGARTQGRLQAHHSYCAVRIRGLWLNEAQQPIANALSNNGFSYVKKHVPTQEHAFQLSELTAVYQKSGKYYGLLAGQSATSSGRITDLEFYELSTK